MFIPIPIFIPQYPYVKIEKINIFRGRTVYEKYTLGTISITAKQQNMIKKNQNLLLDHGVPINKVRFVFGPQFTYDIDKNIINPVYHAFFPMDGNNGKFLNDKPVIEVGKPDNLITVVVGNYKTADNYAYLKEILKRCKRGVAIMISDEIIPTMSGPEVYRFGVDDEVIRFAVLDDAIEHYNAVV